MDCIRYIFVNEHGYVEEVPRTDLLGVIIPREEFETQRFIGNCVRQAKASEANDKRVKDLDKAFKKAVRRERKRIKETTK
jgi:hypothetical protein